MKWCSLSLLFVLCSWQVLGRQELCPVLRADGVGQSDKTGCYVVVLKKQSNHSTFEQVKSRLLELSNDFYIYNSVEKIVKAVTVVLNDSSLETVS